MSDMLQLVGETFALLPLNRICLIFLSAISAQQNREDSLPAERAKAYSLGWSEVLRAEP